ncbi:serine/threonine protein kinase [Polyangium jinanense]|uniref:non-specific serine/threonine protein kinase n=1 Tax=Polyangium jinanense TaxID=2829994 RepID=A0A9X3X1Y4_9BACT|nr:serine/threonine-protein kinase [Polyangium jinanense]MDC3982677.1 serine/threonine protein kinase [Polyangium jinanense]
MTTSVCVRCGAVSRSDLRPCPFDGTAFQAIERYVVPFDASDSLVGQKITDRYRVLRHLSSGGHGKVYLVMHEELHKPFAMKLILDDMRVDELRWQAAIEVFRQDGISTAQIDHHPHVLQIFDAGTIPEGGRYLVYEMLRGKDLGDLQHEEQLSATQCVHMVMQACRGLDAVHAAGLVHRDVKPANMFLHAPSPVDGPGTADPVVKIIDLGIACRKGTWVGMAGTPEYMAPEQFFRGPLDERADVFALGVSLYDLLTGKLPFEATGEDRRTATLRARMTQEPRPPRTRVEMSEELDSVIMRAMARPLEARYPGMMALEDALARTPEGREARASTRVDGRAIGGELERRMTTLEHRGKTIDIVYPAPDGTMTWKGLSPDGPPLKILRNRTLKVNQEFVLNISGRGPMFSFIIHENTKWSGTVRRRAGGREIDLWLHGGQATQTGLEVELGPFGTLRAPTEYRGLLVGLRTQAPERAAIFCIARGQHDA